MRGRSAPASAWLRAAWSDGYPNLVAEMMPRPRLFVRQLLADRMIRGASELLLGTRSRSQRGDWHLSEPYGRFDATVGRRPPR